MALIQRRTEDIGARNNPTDWSAKLPNPKTHIRLLTILPGRQTEELRCTCSTIRLDSRPRYNALSYVWGNPDEKAQVIVNGVQVTVNRSLAEALSRIRRQQGPVVIWADALCINQSDEDEKKYQIDLMHRIYGECENCFVWRGDIAVKGDSSVAAKQAAAAALNALRIIAEEPHHEELGWPGKGPVARSPAGNGLTAGVALQSMMDCEWWHRIWTVQEVCLPPQATVLWGPLEISFQTIMDAASYMVQPDEHPQHNNIFDLFQEGTAIYPKLHTSPFTIPVLSIAHARFWDQSRTNSLNRLWRFRDKRSKYPKDKLFGIWALLNKKYLPNITPADYVLDIVVLFSRVTVSLLTSLNNLKPLIGWRGERETAGLPTWVLDLAQPEDSKCTSDFWTHDIAWRQFYAGRGLPRFKPLLNQAENLAVVSLVITMTSSKRWPAPIHVFSYRALLVVPIILAIATFASLFIHSDVNVALLYSQCDARARLPAVSKVPVFGPPVCFAISFFQSALDSMRTFASMSAILSFIAGLMTVTTIEAARVCNAPNVVIANPTGPWLVFNLIGGAVVWQLVILPAFFHRSRSILLARKKAGQEAVESAASKDPDFGKDSRHLVVDAEIIAIPVSVAWGFILPSLLMLIYNSPVIIVIWLFFPVWVSLIRQAVRWAVLRVQKRQHRSFHLESHAISLLLVYLTPILCSAVSHVYFIWSLFQWDDRKEMTRATVKFVEIDMFFISLTVLYWLFVETGWKVPLVAILGTVPLGPGAGICIAWIYRDTEIREGLKQWLSDVVGSQEEANEEGRASASEETPLLH
ncbi:hypothetical protein SGCOL_002372 [Colletotrichum sp. CLE4]